MCFALGIMKIANVIVFVLLSLEGKGLSREGVVRPGLVCECVCACSWLGSASSWFGHAG